ncbi:MAG: hypothetical protein K2K78_01270, partial [Muribaculaceae bacterium]|nr:hypothetical protein [Muribaculaceae bacterium]
GEKDYNCGELFVLYIESYYDVDADGLRMSLKSVLSRHEMPGRIVTVERIPRTANGKIKR